MKVLAVLSNPAINHDRRHKLPQQRLRVSCIRIHQVLQSMNQQFHTQSTTPLKCFIFSVVKRGRPGYRQNLCIII